MADQIVVNISKAPVTVCMPSGKPVVILPGYAVQGDCFMKYVMSGQIVPLSNVPVGFAVRGVAQPLAKEGMRSDGKSSVSFGNAPKSAKSSTVAPKGTAVSLAESGKEATEENIRASIEAAGGAKLPSSEGTYEGLTVEQWAERLRKVSDNTLGQQMKLHTLRDLARFLGVDSAELLQTKADLISAVRIKTRG